MLESRQREIEARKAELERFTYTVSHDLRSPLVTIRGFLGVIERKLASGDAERIGEAIERIESAAGQMGRLLDDLVDLQRTGLEAGDVRQVSMDELVREVIASLSGLIGERGITLELAPDLPVVRGYRTGLLEVWQNLVENAAKHMGCRDDPRIAIGWREDDGQAVFYVRDNGPEVEPADQTRIFELFHRVNLDTEGTGVGLALAKRIVEGL